MYGMLLQVELFQLASEREWILTYFAKTYILLNLKHYSVNVAKLSVF